MNYSKIIYSNMNKGDVLTSNFKKGICFLCYRADNQKYVVLIFLNVELSLQMQCNHQSS